MRNTPGPAVWDCSGQVVQLKSNLIPLWHKAFLCLIKAADWRQKWHCLLFPRQGRAPVPTAPRPFSSHWLSQQGNPWANFPPVPLEGTAGGTETSPAPRGCAALMCLPKMQASPPPMGTSTGRLCQCHHCPWGVSGGMCSSTGQVQPLNPTACLFVVS